MAHLGRARGENFMQRLGRIAPRGRERAFEIRATSLRANGSRECAPDDRLREAGTPSASADEWSDLSAVAQ